MDIIGAGLTGLIAAYLWPRATLYEIAAGPSPSHSALLRFRSDAVGNATGIPFKRVTVRKGIWYDHTFHHPGIGLANLYSRKCLGGYIAPDRSIWSLDPVERYIAPEDLYEQLVEACESRILWASDYWAGSRVTDIPLISTAPLPETLKHFPPALNPPQFLRTPITVQRFRVPSCEAYQTIYFPTTRHSMYRASLTGDLLIVEHAGPTDEGDWMNDLRLAFQIQQPLEPLSAVTQRYGKIAAIPEAERKALLFGLSIRHRIYSLGRFACWRNTLLDDVISDAAVIKRLIASQSHYEEYKA